MAHLLQANRLSAELYLISAVRLGATALVLDRKRLRRCAAKLDHVGPPRDAERQRTQLQAARDAYAGPGLPFASIDALVQQVALRRGSILDPQPLDVNERALPRAKQVVLKGGKRDKAVLGVFDGHVSAR